MLKSGAKVNLIRRLCKFFYKYLRFCKTSHKNGLLYLGFKYFFINLSAFL